MFDKSQGKRTVGPSGQRIRTKEIRNCEKFHPSELPREQKEKSSVDSATPSGLFPNVQLEVHRLHHANTAHMGNSNDFTLVAESVKQTSCTNMQEVCPGSPDNFIRSSGQGRRRGASLVFRNKPNKQLSMSSCRYSRRPPPRCSWPPESAFFITSSMKSGSCKRKKVRLIRRPSIAPMDFTSYFREGARVSVGRATPCWRSIHAPNTRRQTLLGTRPLGKMEFRLLWVHQLP
jgi:hypothetical protein